MARLEIKPLEMKKYNEAYTVGSSTGYEGFGETVTAANGAKFLMWQKGEKYLVVAKNGASSDATLTFEKNNSEYSIGDIELTVPGNSTVAVQVESAHCKRINESEDKNYVYLKVSANLTIAVYRLV